MFHLQRAALKFGARSSWLRPRLHELRPRHNQHPRRNTSNSSKSSKDSSHPPSPSSNLPPASLNDVAAGETAKPIDIPIPLWYHRLGPVSDFFRWFHRTQTKRPYTVQLCMTLTTYLCGDLLAQDIGGELYDPWRTLRMLTIGAIAAIPGYNWYESLWHRIEGAKERRSPRWKHKGTMTQKPEADIEALQVSLPWEEFQLLLQGCVYRYESRRPASRLHTCL